MPARLLTRWFEGSATVRNSDEDAVSGSAGTEPQGSLG
ncbi:hypothetical protein FHS44_003993 [Streptosporangium saharense]|uniref:Uncharacterized protein n=1 Tax=Streptosporangium saharense TaxID=1706840 RepID=A0A7W7QNJ5_9ACTN|nr:hypothetical protein [Streptosporangium saharense]